METQGLVIFDGVCNFCSRSVQFIINRDNRNVFRFSPMQSEFGRGKLAEFGLNPDDVETILLIKNGTAYTRSDAAVEIAREFSGPWNLLAALILIPEPIRDRLYSLIARYRYQLFGKKDSCLVPTDEIKSRFIE